MNNYHQSGLDLQGYRLKGFRSIGEGLYGGKQLTLVYKCVYKVPIECVSGIWTYRKAAITSIALLQ